MSQAKAKPRLRECMKLLSPEQVRDLFPEGRRPSLRRIVSEARKRGCCCRLGRGIGFTLGQVEALLEQCSGSNATKAVRTGSLRARLKASPYLKARELLTEALRNNTGLSAKETSTNRRHSEKSRKPRLPMPFQSTLDRDAEADS